MTAEYGRPGVDAFEAVVADWSAELTCQAFYGRPCGNDLQA